MEGTKMFKFLDKLFKKPATPPVAVTAPTKTIDPVIISKPLQIEPLPDYGLELIKAFEGCKLQAYQDIVGVWTIGYGQTGPDIKAGLTWTQEQAEAALQREYVKFQITVQKHLPNLTQNQLGALTSFCYNLGESHLKAIAKNPIEIIPEKVLLYCKAGGKIVNGLKVRRQAERALFLLADTSSFDTNQVIADLRKQS